MHNISASNRPIPCLYGGAYNPTAFWLKKLVITSAGWSRAWALFVNSFAAQQCATICEWNLNNIFTFCFTLLLNLSAAEKDGESPSQAGDSAARGNYCSPRRCSGEDPANSGKTTLIYPGSYASHFICTRQTPFLWHLEVWRTMSMLSAHACYQFMNYQYINYCTLYTFPFQCLLLD